MTTTKRIRIAGGIALLSFLLSTGLSAADAPQAMALSLEEALKTALEKNFDVRVETVTLEQADYGLKGAYGIYDPALTLDWSSSVSRQPTTSILQAGAGANLYMNRRDQYNLGLAQFTPWGQQFSLTWDNIRQRTNSSFFTLNPSYQSVGTLGTTLPLLKDFGYRVGHRTVLKAKLDKTIAGDQYRQNLRDTLLTVEGDYWNVVFAIRDLEVKKEALVQARRFQEETRKKIKVGVLAPIEQVAADAQVAAREQDIIVSKQAVGDSEDILKLSMGIGQDDSRWGAPIEPTDEPTMTDATYDEAELIAKASSLRPELKVLANKVEKDKLDTHWAKNQLLPRLDFTGSLTYNGSAGYFVDPATGRVVDDKFGKAWSQITGTKYKSYSVGLSLAVPIGNRAGRASYQSYRLAQNADEIALEKQKLTVANEVRSALRGLQAAQKRIAAAELTKKLQQEKLDAEQKKFENGLSTSFQVLTYQNDLAAAESSLLKARIDGKQAMSTLDRAVGVYLKTHGVELQ